MPEIPSNVISVAGSMAQPEPEEKETQTEEEKEALKLVEKHLSESKRVRANIDQKWMENYRFFRGKQWKEKRPSYRHSEVLNYIFSELMTVLVILTDNRPKVEVLPADPTDFEFAEIINKIITSKWDQYQWSYTVAECVLDSAIYGTSIGSVKWNPRLLDGLGDFTFESEDPFTCYPDPNAKSKINDDYCRYFVTAVPTSLHIVKADYPEKADKIKADITSLSVASFDPYDNEEMRLKSPIDNRILIEDFRPSKSNVPDQVLLITDYMKSDETCEDEIEGEIDPTTGLPNKKYQERLKYPNGRKIVVASGQVLYDGDNPYINGSFPYARLVDHALPREFWGVGEVDQLKSPQQIVNKLISYVLDVLTLMGNPIWVVDTTAQVDTENLTNQPGLIVEKQAGSEVRRESGAQLQPYVLETLQMMTERIMGKLGSSTDVSKGVSPSPNASGYAIEQLQEASQTKLRGKSRNLEYFLKDVGDLMVDRILQLYTVPRVIRITNDEDAVKYFKFGITDTVDESGETKKVATIQEYSQDDAGNYIEGEPRDIELKSKLDLKMSVGSSLPFAKAQKAGQARGLYLDGIIDAEEYLNQIEYPNKEKIVQKLKQIRGGNTFAPGAMPPQQNQEGG